MKMRLFTLVLLTLVAFTASPFSERGYAAGNDIPRINKDPLKGWLGDPDVAVIDARSDHDWTAGDKKIKGAVRRDPKEVKGWASGLSKDRKIVLYCA
jgi:predicted sulfurtransferase